LEKQLRHIREQNRIYETELPAGICDYALYRENPRAYINQHLVLLRLKQMLPVFVAGYYCTPNGKAQILRLDREGVRSGLNFDDVRGLKVFKPPLALQEKFAGMVRQYDRLRAPQRESLRQAEMLFGALLEQSFH
jgi:type I restriction enzyme, S subunit